MMMFRGKIPIAIHPFFWLMAGLIGWMNSGSLTDALTAVAFRQTASIRLVALGGLTSYEGPKLPFWKQFLIVLNGPLFGFGLSLFATLCLPLAATSPMLFTILRWTQIANLFWSVVNLFPVLPLDGGQLLRIAFEAWFGVKGYLASLVTGAILSTLFALGFFLIQAYLAGAFFFLFAFQSFDLWRHSRAATVQDRDDALKTLMDNAEQALHEGKRLDAERLFTEIRQKTSTGLFHAAATQYLAFLQAKRGQKKEAYEMLLPLEQELSDESRCLLHRLAAEHGNWELVAKLSTDCYQLMPTQEAALSNARAFAFLHQPKPAGGWLQTAWQAGGLDLKKVLNEDEFQAIKLDPEFQRFVRDMQ